ncbi:transcriptional regulator with XRE-family HTH domain [Rhodopseudomonas rhenobacensis]|uniref:Transcriptional regulator with XRE-family HTH domain n=1 Tax=Rhodopseudomonas rhenobacensis TaxID=87461 RepID=A0A7W7Z2K7_9BRAD|nr:helix-turn-helix transcriptional regulator [Rhodopseudomonas rhenobacensis]MBB5046868.1 transcriptional regulator with XRE-family HTH domain [Rhodopseudomonas rhenobacensis]
MDPHDNHWSDVTDVKLPPDPIYRIKAISTTLYGTEWRSRIAEGMGVDRRALWQWLSGASEPPADLDSKLARAIRIEVAYGRRRASQLASLSRALALTAPNIPPRDTVQQ